MSEAGTDLTQRELEILQLVATGATNRQIARELVISPNTVKVHLRNIFAKLEVESRTEATTRAIRAGWVVIETPEPTPETSAEPQADAPRWPWQMAAPPLAWSRRLALVLASLLTALAVISPVIPPSRDQTGAGSAVVAFLQPTEVSAETSSASRWQSRAAMPTPRAGLAVAAYGGRVYAIAGSTRSAVSGVVEVYNPQTDAWTVGADKPTPVNLVQGVTLEERIWVAGGCDINGQATDALEVYDPQADRWETRAVLPAPRCAYALVAEDGQLYLFGGWDGDDYVDTVLVYDPAQDLWRAATPSGQPRGFLAAGAIDGNIYVVGGYDDQTEYADCALYHPARDTWEACEPMRARRGGLSLVVVRDGLYALGGGWDSPLAFSESYDPKQGVWIDFDTPVTSTWRSLGAAVVGTNIYALGGWSSDILGTNQEYKALYQIFIMSLWK
jgi:DNA-binding CsgD family transcriptional regulator